MRAPASTSGRHIGRLYYNANKGGNGTEVDANALPSNSRRHIGRLYRRSAPLGPRRSGFPYDPSEAEYIVGEMRKGPDMAGLSLPLLELFRMSRRFSDPPPSRNACLIEDGR